MKALSLQQPWAELIASGRKTIETRTWNTKFKGEFYIHASKTINLKAAKKLKVKNFVTGALIGKARLVDVKKYKNSKDFQKDNKKHLALAKYKPYGYILKNAKRIKPIKYKGALNFFDVQF